MKGRDDLQKEVERQVRRMKKAEQERPTQGPGDDEDRAYHLRSVYREISRVPRVLNRR